MNRGSQILVAVYGSNPSDAALHVGIDLAAATGFGVVLPHVSAAHATQEILSRSTAVPVVVTPPRRDERPCG